MLRMFIFYLEYFQSYKKICNNNEKNISFEIFSFLECPTYRKLKKSIYNVQYIIFTEFHFSKNKVI